MYEYITKAYEFTINGNKSWVKYVYFHPKLINTHMNVKMTHEQNETKRIFFPNIKLTNQLKQWAENGVKKVLLCVCVCVYLFVGYTSIIWALFASTWICEFQMRWMNRWKNSMTCPRNERCMLNVSANKHSKITKDNTMWDFYGATREILAMFYLLPLERTQTGIQCTRKRSLKYDKECDK